MQLIEKKAAMRLAARRSAPACGIGMLAVLSAALLTFHDKPARAEPAQRADPAADTSQLLLAAGAAHPVVFRTAFEPQSEGRGSEAKATYVPGIEILSNTQGVEEFMGYISVLAQDIRRNWEPLIPEKVRAPGLKKGVVSIRFTILPDGTIAPPMMIENSSGDPALDKAAWGAIAGEGKFAPLPAEFHGPNLELRIGFFYNTRVPEGREGGEKAWLASPAGASVWYGSLAAVSVTDVARSREW